MLISVNSNRLKENILRTHYWVFDTKNRYVNKNNVLYHWLKDKIKHNIGNR